MKKWEIQTATKFEAKELDSEKLIQLLLKNRGIKTKKEIDEFFNPDLGSLTRKSLGIREVDLKKGMDRIKKAIEKKEKIIVFGDYDVDGITGSAILWESLNELSADVMPYIPHRISEGYGLSKIGIENLLKQFPDTKLIITVDNGIVANDAVDFANKQKIDVIITDHHTLGKSKPNAFAIVHSLKICGAAVAWFLSRSLEEELLNKKDSSKHLELVALATVADVMQLKSFNRTLVKLGLEELKKTKRPGLLALFEIAGVKKDQVGVYEIGHIIAPRINAMGRLEHAMDSLRLLCTNDHKRARVLAEKLNSTNLSRQKLTFDSFAHAKSLIDEKDMKKLLFISHESYEQGVIGLISGKLTEEYYRPSIVASIGEEFSKASARSIYGFNIIDFIRLSSHLLIDVGGHPMAAGFTFETKNLEKLRKSIEELSEKHVLEELFIRKLKIDCELDLENINAELFGELRKLEPFGYGNPEPVFLAKKLEVVDLRIVGKNSDHLKLKLSGKESRFDAILFAFDKSLNLKTGDKIDAVYSISENDWNGNKKLELKIKDAKKN